MADQFRDVTFRILNPESGEPAQGARLFFELIPDADARDAFSTETLLRLGRVSTDPVDAEGNGTAHLWCNDSGAFGSKWRVHTPWNTKHDFTLTFAPGTPIPLATLIAAGITAGAPNYDTILAGLNLAFDELAANAVAATDAATDFVLAGQAQIDAFITDADTFVNAFVAGAQTQIDTFVASAQAQIDTHAVLYSQLPVGNGTWDVGAGNTLTLARQLAVPNGIVIAGTNSLNITSNQIIFNRAGSTSFIDQASIDGNIAMRTQNGAVTALTAFASGDVTFAHAITVSGGATFTGGQVAVGSNTVAQNLVINGPAASGRQLRFTTAGSLRWQLRVNTIAEAGANAGSNLELNAYDDAGVNIDNPIVIPRAAGGAITMARSLTLTGGALSVAADTDAQTILGRAKIYSAVTDYAYFAHFDMANAAAYGLRQSALGATVLNAPTGQAVALSINNTNVAVATATGLAVTGFAQSSDRFELTGNAAGSVAASMYRSAANGVNIRGIAGTSFDFALQDATGTNMLTFATGTRAAVFPFAVAMSTTLAVTGNATLSGASVGVTGRLSVGGDALAAAKNIDINSAAANTRYINIQSGGINRWSFGGNATAESGLNAGSNWILQAYDDTGTTIDQPLNIARAAGGFVTIARPVSITGTLNLTVGGVITGLVITTTAAGRFAGLGTTIMRDARDNNVWTQDDATILTNRSMNIGNATYSSVSIVTTAGGTFSITNALTTGGDVNFGSNTGGDRNVNINAIAGANRDIRWKTAGVDRWTLRVNAIAESGAAAGSNMDLYRYNDAGLSQGAAISIARATGDITIQTNIQTGSSGDHYFGRSGSGRYQISNSGGNVDIVGGGTAASAIRFYNNAATAVRATMTDLGLWGFMFAPTHTWRANYSAVYFGDAGAVMFSTAGNNEVRYYRNAYDNGTAVNYRFTGTAVEYRQNGTHTFNVAASGTLDTAITWVERLKLGATGIGFNGAAELAKPAITGSRAGNAALASLLTQLAAYGLVTDSTTA